MNVLRQTLDILRVEFLVGCVTSLTWLAGFTLLFAFHWQVGLGVLLVGWSAELTRRERQR